MRTREHYDAELATLNHQLIDLGRLATTAIDRALDALARQDHDLAHKVVADDDLIDRAQHLLEDHAIALAATQQPVARDLRCIIAAIAISGELERVADYAHGIAKLVIGPTGAAALEPPAELLRLGAMARASLDHVLTALANHDAAAAHALAAEEEQIDRFYRRLKGQLAADLARSSDPARSADLLFVAHNLERIADRATNVAERVIYWVSAETVELNP